MVRSGGGKGRIWVPRTWPGKQSGNWNCTVTATPCSSRAGGTPGPAWPTARPGSRAAWRAGAVVTPLIFLVSEDELRHAVADSGAVGVVTTPEFLPKVQAAVKGV